MSKYTLDDFKKLPIGTMMSIAGNSGKVPFAGIHPTNLEIITYSTATDVLGTKIKNVMEIDKPVLTGRVSNFTLDNTPTGTKVKKGLGVGGYIYVYLGYLPKMRRYIFMRDIGGGGTYKFHDEVNGCDNAFYYIPDSTDEVSIIVDGKTTKISRSSAKALNLI